MNGTEKRNRELKRRDELADSVGGFMKYWGFKTIHGRLWTYLYTSPEPMTATELVAQLNVTKSLVSMVLAELLEYDVVERVDLGSVKSPGYRCTCHLQDVIFNVLRTRELKMLETIQRQLTDYIDEVESDSVLIGRLKQLQSITHYARDALVRLLKLKPVSTSRFRKLLRLTR